jgi:putative endonuclease
MDKRYYFYILASLSRTLYVGVTSDLARRVYQHRQAAKPGFSQKYVVDRLVYFEWADNPTAAIEREKQIKRWSRKKKMWLVEQHNPAWNDLAVESLGPKEGEGSGDDTDHQAG